MIPCPMKNISNAYLVLSVSQIRELLVAAEADQKASQNPCDSHCVVLENIAIDTQSFHTPQIGSVSMNSAWRVAHEKAEARYAFRACMNHSDAAI